MKVHQQNMIKEATRVSFTSRLMKTFVALCLLQIKHVSESKKTNFSLVKLGIFLAVGLPPVVISTILMINHGQMDDLMSTSFLQITRKGFILYTHYLLHK